MQRLAKCRNPSSMPASRLQSKGPIRRFDREDDPATGLIVRHQQNCVVRLRFAFKPLGKLPFGESPMAAEAGFGEPTNSPTL
jgi:hypothetical protein